MHYDSVSVTHSQSKFSTGTHFKKKVHIKSNL